MSKASLIIKTAEITPDGILIRSMAVIDGETGQEVKIAKLTPELLSFIKMIEIDTTDYFALKAMEKKNPNIKKLVNTFNLTLNEK